MSHWVALAIAGGGGAACRYLVDGLVRARVGDAFPWGTLVVNVTGSFLIGLVAGAVARGGLPGGLGGVLAAGFCGAYTTFSTLVHDTWLLAGAGAYRRAVANMASLVLGAAAAAGGWAAAAL